MAQRHRIALQGKELPSGKTETINFNEIGITNDFMFGTVFRDPERCRELLQRILRIRIVEIKIVGTKDDQRHLSWERYPH